MPFWLKPVWLNPQIQRLSLTIKHFEKRRSLLLMDKTSFKRGTSLAAAVPQVARLLEMLGQCSKKDVEILIGTLETLFAQIRQLAEWSAEFLLHNLNWRSDYGAFLQVAPSLHSRPVSGAQADWRAIFANSLLIAVLRFLFLTPQLRQTCIPNPVGVF